LLQGERAAGELLLQEGPNGSGARRQQGPTSIDPGQVKTKAIGILHAARMAFRGAVHQYYFGFLVTPPIQAVLRANRAD
jgi:hypothetical protein